MSRFLLISFFAVILFFSTSAKEEKDSKETGKLVSTSFSDIKFRNIGPALMSGRIADIAIHPANENCWYVAVGSGGVWKTVNAGTTWTPVFDKQSSYSIGCVAIDSNNPHTVWIGTGENVGGRHVGYGDGVYRSDDDGANWKNMGLKESQHISRILIHPKNSNIVWVAAQGPLWSKGGDRGIFKTTDGGKTWKKVLGDNEWTGATEIVIDPRDPDVLYAATWQHQRTVAAYIGGGPESAIYRSDDGGDNWMKLEEGLPKTNIGKMGLAVSPQNPDVVYAAIELDRRTGEIYKSTNRGVSWQKQSATVSGATGPHYYQELYACPHQFDRIYLMDMRIQISEDGGKTFRRMKEENKHSDNHSIAFRKDDPNYMIVGTDGGIYETFDLAKNWRFIDNLPVTQFYKVAVDDASPFYNVYGGTQDNNTLGGPSRTDCLNGIRNADWHVVLYADGHQPATEPGNPNIVYAEWQQGNLVRTDQKTGEIVHIQPQPGKGEMAERFNWDSPILVSPHSPSRIYYASNRVWRSDDRGDSWRPISGDLTKNQNRMELPMMGKQWGWDAPWDMDAMSFYNTITSLAESPVKEGLIYAGTDDGAIQMTEDGGQNWKKIEITSMPGLPAEAFINDIKADLFDGNTVYAALDNHKNGDFKSYLYKSSDKGKNWTSIAGTFPERTLIWRVVQDYVRPELLFAATEFGIYFTVDGGTKWVKFTGGLPTISFRDLAIQKRENDLIGASFGRGFFVLDDYSFLRKVSNKQLEEEAQLFQPRDAWWYIPKATLGFEANGSQGNGYFTAPNPPFGVEFTYYLKDDLKTMKEIRQEKDKALKKENKDIDLPDWDKLEAERRQDSLMILLIVKDAGGNVVRRIEGPAKKGFHRVAWDLHYPLNNSLTVSNEEYEEIIQGALAAPGNYTVTLASLVDGVVKELSAPLNFSVKQMREGTLKGSGAEASAEFAKELANVKRVSSAVTAALASSMKKVENMQKALTLSSVSPGQIEKDIYQLKQDLFKLDERVNGNKSKQQVGEIDKLKVSDRIGIAEAGTANSTYGPTPTHRKSLDIAKEELNEIKAELETIMTGKIPALEKKLIEMGSPWLEGNPIPDTK